MQQFILDTRLLLSDSNTLLSNTYLNGAGMLNGVHYGIPAFCLLAP